MTPTLNDYVPGFPKILLIGPAGSGKTLLATTLGARAYVLDLNNGLSSAKLFQDKFTATRQQCEIKCLWDAGNPAAVWKRTVRAVKSFCDKPTHPALVIDGLSDVAEAALGSGLQGAGKWDEESADRITQSDWGMAITQLERLLYRLKAVQAAVVLIGHTKTATVDKRETEVIGVYGRNLPGKVEKMFDEVWYTLVRGSGDNRKYTLQTTSTGGVRCKTRRQLPDGSDMNQGMDALLKKIGWEWEEAEVSKP